MSDYKRNKVTKTPQKKTTKKKKKKKKISILKYLLITFLLIIFIATGATLGVLFAAIKGIPSFNPVNDINNLYEHSEIYSDNGELVEKIQTEEFRTIIPLADMSEYVGKAFIAVEDERFESHFGIDIKGVFRSIYVNIKERSFAQGFSSITQQLARNVYLYKDKKVIRKIKEMYYAIEIEKALTKDQILEAYLNTIYLGQGAYGVQAAAEIYFSKNASELTLAESAMIAGITKSPSYYDIYYTEKPEKVDETMEVIGELEILGEQWCVIFNEKALKRQKLILRKMLEQGVITQSEYDEAISQDMKTSVKPSEKKNQTIETSYFTDFVKRQVVNDLVEKNGYSLEEARNELQTGGLKIYTTMDLSMQSKVEDAYKNFDEPTKVGNPSGIKYISKYTKFDRYGNILNDETGRIAFYKKSNFITDDGFIIIEDGTYSFSNDRDLIIKNNKINYRNLDLANHYEVDENNNIVTFNRKYLNSLKTSEDNYIKDSENKQLIITKSFLSKNEDFYKIDDKNNLLVNPKYYYKTKGILQPQSSIVILDYKTGHLKAIVGGRGIKGEKIFNRATDSPRQPGSSIKPLSIYLPALDTNYTTASIIDDVPHYTDKGEMWPQNWYGKNGDKNGKIVRKTDDFYGLITLRRAVERSVNVVAVKVLKEIGIDTSVRYLEKLGLINKDNPEKDTFVSKSESSNSDEDLAPLSLGGMTKGVTPLTMASAYGAIANQGVYTQPVAYTRVVNSDGEVILENKPNRHIVVNPDVAYVMTDVLRTVVNSPTGTGRNARFANNKGITVAGKTGTTQNHGDHWFVGYTPYYSAAIWTGNDDKSIKLDYYYSTRLFGYIMDRVHDGLPDKEFEKPAGIVTRNICTVSGKLATDLCKHDQRGSTVKSEIFIDGTQPREFCDLHVEVRIDNTNGKIANNFCPLENIITKVMVKRPFPYNIEMNDGYIPTDYPYTVPSEECTDHTENDILENINNWDDPEDNEENNEEDINGTNENEEGNN